MFVVLAWGDPAKPVVRYAALSPHGWLEWDDKPKSFTQQEAEEVVYMHGGHIVNEESEIRFASRPFAGVYRW